MVSVGANFKLGYVLLSQRPADVSVKAISRCSQLYIGRHFEQNDINKLRKFLGWRKFQDAYDRLSKLKRGQFYYMASTPILIETPLHQQTTQPTEYKPEPTPKPKGFWSKLFGW